MRNRLIHSAFHIVSTFCLAGLLIGCSGSTEPGGAIRGSYSLSAVNGQSLPATITTAPWTYTYSSGVLVVSDTSYDWHVCIQDASSQSLCGNGYQVQAGGGTWKVVSGGYLFTERINVPAQTVQLNGNSLVLHSLNGSVAYTFTKS